jgi:hypothetical protein
MEIRQFTDFIEHSPYLKTDSSSTVLNHSIPQFFLQALYINAINCASMTRGLDLETKRKFERFEEDDNKEHN